MKIVITGTPCAGKTTLAQQLRERGYWHIEVDALLFGPNWSLSSPDVIREKVKEAMQTERWVFDGNYVPVREIVWSQADVIVWLDYPLWLILWRAVQRTFWRFVLNEELWNGNHEHVRHLLSRNSIFLIIVRDWKKRRAQYPEPFNQFPNVPVLRLRTKKETQEWLDDLSLLMPPSSPILTD